MMKDLEGPPEPKVSRLKFWKFLPTAAYFLLWNEFAERFAWYGLVAILPMFLTAYLSFSQSASVEVMHAISFSSYLFAFMGSFISDVILGKFWTIVIFSTVYAAGVIALSISAIPSINAAWLTITALSIITLGTGGIKPCVSAFGGDQIENPEARANFFSYFYMMVNIGSLLSTFLTPLIKKQHCLGREDCFAYAFGLPAILMVVAVFLFSIGKAFYKPRAPPNDDLQMVVKASGSAIATKATLVVKRIPHKKPESFFYYAKDDYPMQVLEDCRAMSGLFFCFLPLCLYWGLYSQMNSRWIFQAAQMNGRVSNSFSMMPEQMSIINCILVILLVKPFDLLLFPLIAKIRGRPLTYMNKISIAMFLGVLAFIVTAILQGVIESKGTFAYNPANPNVPMCVNGCLNIFWQIPQYFLLTVSEVFLSVANINLAYAMAPKRLKSFGGAVSLLTNAVGNLLVMLTTKWDPIKLITKKDVPLAAYLFWAALCFIGMIWFMLVSKKYEHYDREIVEVQDAEVAEMKEVTTETEDNGIGATTGPSTSTDALLINDNA